MLVESPVELAVGVEAALYRDFLHGEARLDEELPGSIHGDFGEEGLGRFSVDLLAEAAEVAGGNANGMRRIVDGDIRVEVIAVPVHRGGDFVRRGIKHGHAAKRLVMGEEEGAKFAGTRLENERAVEFGLPVVGD